jgi:SAM-dependent methyltransferase
LRRAAPPVSTRAPRAGPTDTMRALSHDDLIADLVRRFYDSIPFPGYAGDRYTSTFDLFGNANAFARALDYQIPYGTRIADIGCGTGQLACLLTLKSRTVLGLDFSESSIRKARALAEKLHLGGVRFEYADVLDMPPPDESFDYVFCLGVLHHTADPYRGFRNLLAYGKPGGFVIIGLYNSCGRLWLKARRGLRAAFRMRGGRRGAARALHGGPETDVEKDYSWFMDQYEHPYESSHTVREVLGWFKKHGVEFVSAVPRIALRGGRLAGLFIPGPSPAPAMQWLAQTKWVWTLRRTGGYFVMIGRIQ